MLLARESRMLDALPSPFFFEKSLTISSVIIFGMQKKSVQDRACKLNKKSFEINFFYSNAKQPSPADFPFFP